MTKACTTHTRDHMINILVPTANQSTVLHQVLKSLPLIGAYVGVLVVLYHYQEGVN